MNEIIFVSFAYIYDEIYYNFFSAPIKLSELVKFLSCD